MQRRAQAALEFLTTYAWAFLVIIIMVGALAYFGVLSPSKLLPERCNFGAPFTCNKDFLVLKKSDADTITMRFVNGGDAPITITDATIESDVDALNTAAGASLCTTARINYGGADTVITTGGQQVTIPSGDAFVFEVDCVDATKGGDQLIVGEKVKFSIDFNWYPTAGGPTYSKLTLGEIFATVQ